MWLYVPNLISYARVALGIAAFTFARDASAWRWFVGLYFASYALDAIDGVAARALGQVRGWGRWVARVWTGCQCGALGDLRANAG